MKKSLIILASSLSIFFYSCDGTEDLLSPAGLSDSDIISGLKEALRVGTDTSVSIVSSLDGYYKDDLIKVLLPPEADIIFDGINTIRSTPLLGTALADELDGMVEDVVLGINRAAEDAAKDAAPIFVDAITGMSIGDGFNILNGEDTAATHFLKNNTFEPLVVAFKPKMQTSLNRPLVAGVSAQDTWSTLTSKYNTAAESLPGKLAGLQPVATELDDYVTRKGLTGLFSKVAEEEKRIRKNPLARVTDILQKVFSTLDP